MTPTVFLTLSCKGGRYLELNWSKVDEVLKDSLWIGLFDQNPAQTGTHSSDPLLSLVSAKPLVKFNVQASQGYIRTKFKLSRDAMPSSPPDKTDPWSLGYWIALVRTDNGVLVALNCLRLYPTWMEDESQEDSVYRQLLHGIRYLDLRIGYYTHTSTKFWVNHDRFRIRPLKIVIADILRFLAQFPKEIIILDFHRFPYGFDLDKKSWKPRHLQLIELIQTQLGAYILPSKKFTESSTLNQIWAEGKSILISYAASWDDGPPWPWLVSQKWGNKQKLEDLEKYLTTVIHRRGGRLWAAMAELTPTKSQVILHPFKGVRPLAQKVNVPLSLWYSDDKYGERLNGSNIIATDFFLGNNLIQICIQGNRDKGKDGWRAPKDVHNLNTN